MNASPRPDRSETCVVCGADLPRPSIHGRDRLHGVPGTFSVAICRSCGAGNTLPRGTEIDLASYYPAEYGAYGLPQAAPARAASRAIRAWQGWRALRTAPLAALRGASAGRAVDVGCGRGDLAATLIDHGWSVTGVEPSESAREVASSRGVDARGPTLAESALERSAYDAAIFRHSLEHVPDPVGDLERAAAALASDGLLLVTVPNFDCWQRHRFGDRWYHLDLPRHRVHFGRNALRRALEKAGFRLLETSTSTSSVGLPATLQYAAFGRLMLRGGMAARVWNGLASGLQPLSMLVDRLGGGADVLHAVARRI